MLTIENKDRLIYALTLAIEAKFDASEWTKLAYEIDEVNAIEGHSRLIRSLNWSDPDYTQNVIEVLKQIGRKPEKLARIAEHINLADWLETRRSDLYNELYKNNDEPSHLLDENPLDTDTFDLTKQLRRIYSSLEEDPELALGTTKEMVETVLKTILSDKVDNLDDLDMPALIKAAQKHIKLIPDDVAEANKGNDTIKRTLSNLGQIVVGITELRNAYGTGHGKVKNESGLQPYHARLVVNAGVTLAKFLMEVSQDQNN
ncbi:abortive infection family protein [Peribacillus frigoritolerans]|uniref:abortive infection family protein n=1 Tax=Peribacillus frigoritolerans TaxID=450367 RepID=UPI00207AADC6|nr:abortive infection family protein [Peribacillus frigoritolerans]USK64827.1 abortive infection family protein [Peribacillus frigoritolerans]